MAKKSPSNKINWSQEQVKQIIRLYTQQKISTLKIAKTYTVDKTTINKLLKKHGVQIRESNNTNFVAPTQNQIQQIIEMYTIGKRSSIYIAKLYNVSYATISRILHKNNIEIRSKQECNRKFQLDQTAFSTITQQSSYWIGMLLADGAVLQNNIVRLKLAQVDKQHVDLFRKFLKSNQSIKIQAEQKTRTGGISSKAYYLAVSSKNITQDIAKYGVVRKKSLTAKTSQQLLFNRDFWRGCIDGDGSVLYNNNKRPTIKLNGSYYLMQQFHTFVKSVIPQYKCNINKSGSIFRVQVTGEQAVTLTKHLYQDAKVALPRKMQKAQRIIQQDWKTLKHMKEQAQ